ncbi:MAG: T6SS immunity protein Tdi1 domain-containing protein [Cyclobacteriaceae bacterium]
MILESINKHWAWTGIVSEEIVSISDFGNVIFKSSAGDYWRICPEELCCKVIADTSEELESIMKGSEFLESWEMVEHLQVAKAKMGELNFGEKYCLKLPVIFGGEYSEENFGTILHIDQIAYAGQMTEKIDDLPDGTKIEFNV